MTDTLQDTHTARVLALLAKAESTEYPEEAEAFFAKAQELMARHSIDEAMLAAAGTAGTADPSSSKVVCRAPYATGKAILLNEIAGANNCKAIRIAKSGGNQVIHLFGFPEDLRNTEALFVALSAHATRELLNAEVPPYETARAFRHAFLVGFGGRIGQRLAAAQRTARAGYEAETGRSTALVLADRSVAVRDAFTAEYPRTTTASTSTSSGAGARSGSAAADRANLGQRAVAGGRQALGAGR